jgi:hypothetical protein
VRLRRDFDWVSVWLLLSAVLVVVAVPVSKFYREPDARGFVVGYVTSSLVSLLGSTIVALRLSYLRGEGELRRRQGLCPRCGYNLQDTPGRCPKCCEGAT